MNKSMQKVFDVLNDYQPHTRQWICEKTQLSRTTVYNVLDRLELLGYIERWSEKNRIGRPNTMFCRIRRENEIFLQCGKQL